jgi:5-methylcytosine-specific restriction protein A
MQPCNEPGCPVLVERGKCAMHRRARQRRSDSLRPNAYRRGYDARWERTRRAYLKAHPICEEPGCDAKTTDVDHIDGLGPLGPRGHDWTNLRAFCHPHHSQRTAGDQPGGWNTRVNG